MSRTLHTGYDVRTPDPGECESMDCMACGEVMDVERNMNGPTGMAEAMSGRGHLHDVFTCPNAGKPWHVQVIALLEDARTTPSVMLKRIVLNEANGILRGQGKKQHPLPAVPF